MKRTALLAMSALLSAALLGGCTKDHPGDTRTPRSDAGYLALRVDLAKTNTRGSTEHGGLPAESALHSLYLVTFDAAGNVVVIPDGGGYYIDLNATELQTVSQPGGLLTKKVAGSAVRIMAVANPGANLLDALNRLGTSSTFASFNTMIEDAEAYSTAGGFAMISCASDALLSKGNKISDALIAISPAVVGTTFATDALAIAHAQANPTRFSIERLAAKLVFKPVDPANVEVLPAGANFTPERWTADVINTRYFPFAEKTVIGEAADHAGSVYKYNFYTTDPNYFDVAPPLWHSGLAYVALDADKAPVALTGWMTTDNDAAKNLPVYLLENTMDGPAQRYGNATRIVISGRYTPVGFTPDADWFSFGGTNYQTLADLQAAFAAAAATDPLKDACKNFAAQMGSTDFATMTAADLAAKAPNGGEWAKVPTDGLGIRFYQGGKNYWFYEIRHNSEAAGTMEWTKYGVVRNNWYNCALNRVSGPGTPWYPDPRNPGGGDPDPWTPIDDAYGYIGIEITPAPWIVWENGMII